MKCPNCKNEKRMNISGYSTTDKTTYYCSDCDTIFVVRNGVVIKQEKR